MSSILTTGQVARELTAREGLSKPLTEWQIRRLFEKGDLPEPPKFGGKRAISRSDLPAIEAALRARGWMPSTVEA